MYWYSVPRIVPALGQRLAQLASRQSENPVAGTVPSVLSFASPKSRSFAPAFVSMMLAGFRSRCVDPLAVGLIERVGDLDGVAAAPGRGAGHPSSSRWATRFARPGTP